MLYGSSREHSARRREEPARLHRPEEKRPVIGLAKPIEEIAEIERQHGDDADPNIDRRGNAEG